MHVLQLHKFFYPHAGTETALFNTRELLINKGHQVLDFAMRDAKNLPSPTEEFFAPRREYSAPQSKADQIKNGASAVYSFASRRKLAGLLDQHPVHVAHMHLISHQLTFSVVDELRARGIPTVLTLHDYKIGCPAYTLYRSGERCYECVGRAIPTSALRHKCIKGSRAASLVGLVEASLANVRSSWESIDALIAPSTFAADIAMRSGYPIERIFVLPNFLPHEEFAASIPPAPEIPTFLLAGRLEEVKGFRWALEAISRSGEAGKWRFQIAGAGGALAPWVEEFSRGRENIQLLGRLTRDELRHQMRKCTATIIPSLWDENYPYSLIEARAAGLPVIATRVGGMTEMVSHGHDGFLVQPGNDIELLEAINTLSNDRAARDATALAGAARALRENSSEAHYQGLMQVYGFARDR